MKIISRVPGPKPARTENTWTFYKKKNSLYFFLFFHFHRNDVSLSKSARKGILIFWTLIWTLAHFGLGVNAGFFTPLDNVWCYSYFHLCFTGSKKSLVECTWVKSLDWCLWNSRNRNYYSMVRVPKNWTRKERSSRNTSQTLRSKLFLSQPSFFIFQFVFTIFFKE